jgi:5-methylcytosine-specific restriction endonuclease McrA
MTMASLVKQTYPPICWLCGGSIDNDNDYSIDHVVARSKGGSVWDLDNLRPAHIKCNMSRGNRDPKRKNPLPRGSRPW